MLYGLFTNSGKVNIKLAVWLISRNTMKKCERMEVYILAFLIFAQ